MAGLEVYDAVNNGDVAFLKHLVARGKLDVNAKFTEVRNEMHNNMCLIHLASRNGYRDMVSFLLQSGCAVNITTDAYRKTPLHFSAHNQRISCVRLLLRSGASVNVQDLFGNTPCHYSSEDGSCQILDLLIRNGVNVNAQDIVGKTPLMKAVRNKKTDAVLCLLQAGADSNLIDSNNDTALHFAARYGFDNIIDILLSSGSLKDVQNCLGRTALMEALCCNYTKSVGKLIEAGCDLNCQESQTGDTALHTAVKKNDTNLVRVLLQAGARHDVYNHQGESAFFEAVAVSKGGILQLMIDFNCKLGVPLCLMPYVVSKTAFQVAAEKGHLETCRWLAQLGHLDYSTRDFFYTNYLPARPIAQDADLAWLQEAMQHVISLRQLCRKVIRQSCDHQLSEKVECMPVPRSLKDYILFADRL